jgi:hypothetical protein
VLEERRVEQNVAVPGEHVIERAVAQGLGHFVPIRRSHSPPQLQIVAEILNGHQLGGWRIRGCDLNWLQPQMDT